MEAGTNVVGLPGLQHPYASAAKRAMQRARRTCNTANREAARPMRRCVCREDVNEVDARRENRRLCRLRRNCKSLAKTQIAHPKA